MDGEGPRDMAPDKVVSQTAAEGLVFLCYYTTTVDTYHTQLEREMLKHCSFFAALFDFLPRRPPTALANPLPFPPRRAILRLARSKRV